MPTTHFWADSDSQQDVLVQRQNVYLQSCGKADKECICYIAQFWQSFGNSAVSVTFQVSPASHILKQHSHISVYCNSKQRSKSSKKESALPLAEDQAMSNEHTKAAYTLPPYSAKVQDLQKICTPPVSDLASTQHSLSSVHPSLYNELWEWLLERR